MPPSAYNPSASTVEATVTSKGQVTLPKELRNHLGIQTGSKIRFSISDRAPVTVEPVLYDLEDLWRMADQKAKPQTPMTFEEMNAAKVRREW
ncbi:MAG: AbrB/MazE/SpoVT family DNA-binding domain-containing protein [Terracidiphilus sp.]